MDYFIMQQDPQINNIVVLKNWQSAIYDDAPEYHIAPISIKTRTVFVEDQLYNEYPDFLAEPIPLIAKDLMQVITLYQKDIIMHPVVLIEKKTKLQTVYYSLNIPEIECASEKSKLDHIGKIKELVIDKNTVAGKRIFRVAGYEKRIIVRLDVAESILRRETYGITFEKLNSD